MPCLNLTYVAGLFAQVTLDVFSEVDVAEKADSLAVATACVEQAGTLGDVADFVFPQMSDGEDEFAHLQCINLAEEVGLVFHWVWAGGKPRFTVDYVGGGIVARCGLVKFVTYHLFEASELDEFVAHHIGIGREALSRFVHRIADHFVPVFFVQVDDVQFQVVAT